MRSLGMMQETAIISISRDEIQRSTMRRIARNNISDACSHYIHYQYLTKILILLPYQE